MKNIRIYSFLLFLSCFTIACQKSDIKVFSDSARIQLKDSITESYSFIYQPKSLVQDTVWLTVNTIGGFTNMDRSIKLVQITEYRDSIRRDPSTNQILDTIKVEVGNKAIAGTHYIDFEDPALKKLIVVKANEVVAHIPIVLLRDASLGIQSYRLKVELHANENFGLGEKMSLKKTIIFSDRLERFDSWKTDGTASSAFNAFGKYSTGKHQFMIDVIGEQIDENWYKEVNLAQASSHYKNLLKSALIAFNSDPGNIASGKAPLKENGPNTPTITFP